MNADNNMNKNSGKWFLAAVICIFLCNLVMFLLLINCNFESKRKIVITSDSKVLDSNNLEDKIANLTETAAQNQKMLTAIVNERTAKAKAYLNAARSSSKDPKNPEIAQILYISALSYSSDKAPILKEFIDWQGQFIDAAVKENNIELARERLLALASICDANISAGSVNDMTAIPLLKQKLSSFESQILKRASENIAGQQVTLNKIAQQIETLSSYAEAEQLLNELTNTTCDVSLNEEKDRIAARIIQKQPCLTTSDQPLMLPAINSETPWVAWLGNFAKRLESNLPISKKLEDIGTAADILQAAKQSSVEGVNEKIAEIERVSRKIYLAYWQERADRVLKSSEPSVNDISALLSECNTFKKEEQTQGVDDRIIKLNKLISTATLKELEESLNNLKKSEESLKKLGNSDRIASSEAFIQMTLATQSQYVQVLLQLQGLEKKYRGKFGDEIKRVSEKIACLGQLIDSYKNKLSAEYLRKKKEQRERFVKAARERFKEAERYFKDAEGACNKDQEYERAWNELMKIHPNDLKEADPNLAYDFDELKKKCVQKNRKIHPSNKKVIRITDFE